MALSNKAPENTFGGNLDLAIYSRGMGSIGLPGDVSSQSRFCKKFFFVKENSVSGDSEKESVSVFPYPCICRTAERMHIGGRT